MAKNLLVINCDIRETRVALIENGIIAELHLERAAQVGTLGNIYLGKVSRVLPGMQAAFIDIGLERAAFLHVEDLIRPDDFEAYLAGHRTAMGHAQDGSRPANSPNEEDAGEAPADPHELRANAPALGEGGPEGAAAELSSQAHSAVARGNEPMGPTDRADARGAQPAAGAAPGEPGSERRGRRRRRGRGRRTDGRDEAGTPGGPATEAALDAAAGEGDDPGDAVEGDDEAALSSEPRQSDRAVQHGPDANNGADADNGSAADDAPLVAATPIHAESAPTVEATPPPRSAPPVTPHARSEPIPRSEPAPRSEAAPRSEPRRVAAPTVTEVANAVPAADAIAAAPAAEGEEPAVPARRRARSRKSRSTSEVREANDSAPVGEGGSAEAAPPRHDDPAADIRFREEPLGDREVIVGSEGEVVVAGGEAPRSLEDEAGSSRSRRGRARTRRSGRTTDRREKMDAVVAAPAQSPLRKAKVEPLRVSKSTPIREVVREGQEVIVQVSKEPIGTKGARVTSHVSLPGRYVVYLPTVEHVGISKRIGSDKERSRLRSAIDAMKPPTGGLIVRTLAEGLTKKDLKNDVGYLVRLWGEVIKKRETTNRAPECLYTELDIVLRTARDLFTDDIEKIVIDDAEQFARLKRFLEMFMPERADAVELYEGSEPIFDEYGIEEEIGRALSRKVPLDSGGHLVIDQAEALTAIDVNTGRFVGKGSTDLEDTILKTNLEAVQEIAYQLRFRNLGGLIILDLIDMEKANNREKVRRRLEDLLAKDKAKTTLNRISDLGLIEMTRKRTRESLSRTMNEPCFYCDGTGNLQSKQTIGYEILRQIKREAPSLRGYVVMVAAHPAVVDLLKHEERAAVIEAEKRYHRRIELVPRKDYHLEQFDIQGR